LVEGVGDGHSDGIRQPPARLGEPVEEGVGAADIAVSRPTLRTVSTSSTAPAWGVIFEARAKVAV
ncbi:hypothetical protein, partial [Streptomyces sp. NPDC002346]